MISFRFIRVPRSHSLKNRAQKRRWLLSANSLNSCFFLFLSPLHLQKSTKNRAKKEKKSIRKTIRLTLTRSDSLRTNAGSHGNLRRFLQRNLRRNGSAGWKLNSRHWNCLLFVCVKVELGKGLFVFQPRNFFRQGGRPKERKRRRFRTAEGVLTHTEEKKSTKHRNEYLQVLSSAHALDILRSYYYSY